MVCEVRLDNVIYSMFLCRKCNRTLPREAFGNNRFKKTGMESICRECQCEYLRSYYQTHKDEAAAYGRKYRQDNMDKIAERDHRYYLDNKSKIVARIGEYNKANKSKVDEYQRKYRLVYYQDNKSQINVRNRKNSKTEPGKIVRAIANHKRRARLVVADGNYTKQQWMDLVERQKNRCYYEKQIWALGCKGKFTDKNRPTIDHIVALSNGGTNHIENIVAACQSCNSSKRNRRLLLC